MIENMWFFCLGWKFF